MKEWPKLISNECVFCGHRKLRLQSTRIIPWGRGTRTLAYYVCCKCNCTVTTGDLRFKKKLGVVRCKPKIYTQPTTEGPKNITKGRFQKGFIHPPKEKAIDGRD